MNYRIEPATPDHALIIAKIICMAIGEDLVNELAGDSHTTEDVEGMFMALAKREDSQYSYKNACVALTEDGKVAGAVVAYAGNRLHYLRKAFFEEAVKWIDLNLEGDIPDETDPEEYYLDSLGVMPEYRECGIARSLIDAVEKKASKAALPVGLLVSKTNPGASKLYESLGFRYVGERPFAGEMMNHLILSPIS